MSERRVSDILIEQYVLGEFPAEKAREIERSPGFAERVAAIERDNAAFLEQHPANLFAKRIENQYEAARPQPAGRSRPRSRAMRFLAIAAPGAVAVAALAFVILGGVTPGSGPVVDPGAEIVRMKGLEPSIAVFRAAEGSGETEELTDGDTARQGDRLQITYNSSDAPYGMIVSVDGRGAVTLHYPVSASREPELVVGGDQQLPYAYILDDAPDFERFLFITSDRPFSVAGVLESIQDQADALVARPSRDLSLDRGLNVHSVTLRKGA